MIILNDELSQLNNKILAMGTLVEGAIADAVKALRERDTELAREVIRKDIEVNTLDVEIDEKAMELIALMQPVAGDMRLVVTAMKLTTDIERIGDKAANIAKRAVELNEEPPLEIDVKLDEISDLAQLMTQNAIRSFITRDNAMARGVIAQDDEVNRRYRESVTKILELMTRDSSTVSRAVKLNAVLKHLERIADHATNIAEMVIYLIEGKIIRHTLSQQNPKEQGDK